MKTTREQLREALEFEIGQRQQMLANINAIPGLDDLTLTPTFFAGSLDFDNLKREDVEAVLRHIGGKWDKSPDENATVNYVSVQNGVTVRMWRGQKFKHYWQVNMRIDGSDGASEWMAIHIGLLNEQVDDLKRRIKRLERVRKTTK